jgi:hypothetical protein
MTVENAITILLSGSSIVAGAFLGGVRSKLFAEKSQNKFHVVFYSIGGFLITGAILLCIVFYKDFFDPFNAYYFFVLVAALIAGLALVFFTKRFLITKTMYSIEELNPIINGFTKSADKAEIKLFGGDLNFFGHTPEDVDINVQYIELKALGFKKISILCERPADSTQKIRYGKLYHDIKNIELKYYEPNEADLKVRGRIIKVQGKIRLLMYTKHSDKTYEAIATDVSDSKGLLYDNIWRLSWTLAKKPTPAEIDEYLKLYNER